MSGNAVLVIGTPESVSHEEHAFVESALPWRGWTTYSNVLEAPDCAAIDREAYARARSWYRLDGAYPDADSLPKEMLGRAFELPATAMLITYLRAKRVLSRLTDQAARGRIEVRGSGEEWFIAAEALGLEVTSSSWVGRRLMTITPDPGAQAPSRSQRWLMHALRLAKPSQVDVILSESPRWIARYHAALLDQWPALVLNPRRGLLLDALFHRRFIDAASLSDVGRAAGESASAVRASGGDRGGRFVAAAFMAAAPKLTAWAGFGQVLAGRAPVSVAAQDVTPSVRAALLGFRASGGRVITIEHGIAGGYAEQVHSVADTLGAWGPIQAEYHRGAGPDTTTVVELGWPRLAWAVAESRENEPCEIDVAFFAQPTVPLSAGSWPEDGLFAHSVVERYAELHPARRVAVKHHPATRAYHDDPVAHAQASSAAGDSIAIIRRSRIVACATPGSTTALEALALGRPVIRVASRGQIGPVDFLGQSGAVTTVAGAAGFDAAVERLLSDDHAYRAAVESGRAYAASFITGLHEPGLAEERLASLIRDAVAR